MRRYFSLVIALLNFLIAHELWGQEFNGTLQMKVRGKVIEGTPIHATEREVTILGRDGYLWNFDPREASDYQKSADYFQAYSSSELRGRLQSEFGRGFEVTGTGQYLVVHPSGQGSKWAPRFDELYRSFVHYFNARGIRLSPLKFPLIAVVFPRQVDFQEHARREGLTAGNGILGYYTPRSNRILMYDSSTGGSEPRDWHVNAETIIHEAAHQIAFNTGIHNRHAMPPRWLAEGFGSLFEARGVWNSRENTKTSDRINKMRLDSFRSYAKKRPAGAIVELVSSDRIFQSNVDAAYAESWALTYFLSETEPRKYAAYLQKTAARAAGSDYKSNERIQDFTEIFGANLQMLEARFLRYIGELR